MKLTDLKYHANFILLQIQCKVFFLTEGHLKALSEILGKNVELEFFDKGKQAWLLFILTDETCNRFHSTFFHYFNKI